MAVVEDFTELQEYIQNVSKLKTISLISIDGADGSGKSRLAKQMKETLNYAHMELDCDRYYDKNKGGYLRNLKNEIIKSDVIEFLSDGWNIAFDGVCNLKILHKLDLKADLRIYVKKAVCGVWEYGEKLDYSRGVEDVISELGAQTARFKMMAKKIDRKEVNSFELNEGSLLQEEILRYHFEYTPDLHADLVLENIYVKL